MGEVLWNAKQIGMYGESCQAWLSLDQSVADKAVSYWLEKNDFDQLNGAGPAFGQGVIKVFEVSLYP